MDWIWWIVIGLLAGAAAKALMPGDKNEPKGCLMTMLLGIGGSVLVGFVLHSVLHVQTMNTRLTTFVGAVIGAMALIWIGRALSK